MSRLKGVFDNVWESLAVNLACPFPICLARCGCGEKNVAKIHILPGDHWMMSERDE